MSRSALLGETGRIPVSEANEPEGRNPAGGTDKAERRRTQGAARRSRRQAQQCPVKVGGKWSNEDGTMVIQTVGWAEYGSILASAIAIGSLNSGPTTGKPNGAEALLRIGDAG